MSRALLLLVGTFLGLAPCGGWVIRQLLQHGIGKHIRYDGPASHQVKAGTATMGGLYILAGVAIVTALLSLAGRSRAVLPLLAMLAFGALGAFDDLRGLRDAQGVGWLARLKFPWQCALSALLAAVMYLTTAQHLVVVPVTGRAVGIGWWFVPVAAVAIVATANAVNFTDGLDGLAGGTLALAFAAYGALAWASGDGSLTLFCFAVVGALLAFLWYNVHPARMFMGDVGSQALGAGLAAVAVLSGHWLLLPIIGVVFLAEVLSVMGQVIFFKYTRRKYGEGRRILRMAPLHHHFEQGGMSEVQITLRFWLAAAVAAALGVAAGLGWGR